MKTIESAWSRRVRGVAGLIAIVVLHATILGGKGPRAGAASSPASFPASVGSPFRGGAGPGDVLSQAEVGQQQLRGTTARVGEQLDVILAEFGRNGIAGEEVQLLGAIRGLLGQLSEEDMARVISLLQEARGLSESGEQRGRLLEAFGGQKTVGVKLRQILLEYQRQQELAGVAARLEELATRQHVAMRDTLSLALSGAGRKREWLSENQRISLQLQVSEQASLRDEVVAVMQRLQAWEGDSDNDAAGRASEAMAHPEVKRLGQVLDGVIKDLNTAQLLSATGRQRMARGLLRELARQLVIPPDEVEALQAAVREIEVLVARQDGVRELTRQGDTRPASVAPVVGRQAELVDDTDVAAAMTSSLDVAAGEQVRASVSRMQEARGALENAGDVRARRLSAATQQDLALARLATAKRLLEQRIESLEKQRLAAADPLTNLQQVREDVAALLEQQKQLKVEAAQVESDPEKLRPMAPRQGDLGDKAADASDRAALDSSEAAEFLSQAMRSMRGSQKSLGTARNDPGAQQAAIDSLAKALDELDRKLAELEAAEKELALMEELLKRLIALIEAQQELIDETARLARKLDGRASKEVGGDQETLAEATRQLESDLPDSVASAATYLADGATQMILAGNELGASRPAEARPPQDEALANLLRARRELEDRLAQLKEMLGRPPDEASLEQLAELIKQAQQDVNSAMSAEELSNAAKGLKKASKQIRPATSGRLGRMPRMVRDPLQRADRALAEGAASAEAGDQAGSEGEAGEAQAALAAAAAAIDLAMAGMGQQPGQGDGQGGEGNSAGQGEGKGRGRRPGSRAGKGTGDAGNFFGSGGADGPRSSASGSGRYIGLPARERAALLQSQGERYPREYAPMIEQYLKNLSDQVGEAPK
ncbi:MAG: hypothetical protein AB7O66_02985 [Limisphaerales bacterium]